MSAENKVSIPRRFPIGPGSDARRGCRRCVAFNSLNVERVALSIFFSFHPNF